MQEVARRGTDLIHCQDFSGWQIGKVFSDRQASCFDPHFRCFILTQILLTEGASSSARVECVLADHQ